MNKEQQRIAIGKACGWKKVYKGPEPDDRFIDPKGNYSSVTKIPDYCNDLNACHEVEKTLTEDQWVMYGQLLLDASRGGLHATAAQRAEALLRTLNLRTQPQTQQ